MDGDKIQPNLEAACEHPHSQLQNELNFNFVLAITSNSYSNQLLDQVWIRLVIRKSKEMEQTYQARNGFEVVNEDILVLVPDLCCIFPHPNLAI